MDAVESANRNGTLPPGMDVINVTIGRNLRDIGLPVSYPCDQVHKHKKILDPKTGPPTANAQVWILRDQVRPARGHRVARTVREFESNPVLTVDYS